MCTSILRYIIFFIIFNLLFIKKFSIIHLNLYNNFNFLYYFVSLYYFNVNLLYYFNIYNLNIHFFLYENYFELF
jgi:hypothetical protein